MKNFEKYSVTKQIYNSPTIEIYKAFRKRDKKVVIIKTLKNSHPTSTEIGNFRYEFEILQKLKSSLYTPTAYSFERYQNSFLIVLQETKGIEISKIFDLNNFNFPLFYKIAKQTIQGISEIHSKGIIHKSLNPYNIFWDIKKESLQIVNFSDCTELSEEKQNIYSIQLTNKNLAYISPEQTGRMNCEIDYRSDFYSLGVTFYKILTDRLPFEAKDHIGWVHAHIAKSPANFNLKQNNIPKSLEQIILKLLKKNPDERYLSTNGILKDIEKSEQYWKDKKFTKIFDLGKLDILEKFKIPKNLYGREKEIKTLFSTFEKVEKGKTELFILSGYSGVGKTSLVNEIHKPLTKDKGYFVDGKFDQFTQNIPYYALSKAFSKIAKQIFSETKEQLEIWKSKLLKTLSTNAKIITDLVPEFEKLIGKQPDIEKLNPIENQNRFKFTIIKFLNLFAQKNHPLAIFLDDLQWSDIATLHLIKEIILSKEVNYLFLIGAYRDNEVSEHHHLKIILQEIEKEKTLQKLFLKPLNQIQVNQLVSETLHSSSELSLSLSKQIFQKTEGNPFFVRAFLKNLYEGEQIKFDKLEKKWTWDIEIITNIKASENVAELMIQKLEKLPIQTMEVLKLAACIGNHFDLTTLSLINKKSTSDTAKELKYSIFQGIIIPLNKEYKLVYEQKNKIDTSIEYKFQHDQVQKAAYSFIQNNQEKKEIHLQIGRLMLKDYENGNQYKATEIIRHLNEGRTLITDIKFISKVIELNLIAAQQAKFSTAYNAAYQHLNIGLEFLKKNNLNYSKNLWFEVHKEFAEVSYLLGEFKTAEEYIQLLIEKATTSLEKAEIHYLQTVQYVLIGKIEDAILIAINTLQLLGLDISVSPVEASINKKIAKIESLLSKQEIATLINQPILEDYSIKMMMKLLMELFAPAYLSGNKLLFTFTTLSLVELSILHGNTPESAYAYILYGMILTSFLNQFKKGYEFGKLGIALNEQLNNSTLKSRTLFIYAVFVHPWNHHWKTLPQYFEKAIELGYQSGDLFYMSQSCLNIVTWNTEINLLEASEKMDGYLDRIQSTQYQDAWDTTKIIQNYFRNLCGKTNDLYSLSTPEFNEEEGLNRMLKTRYYSGIAAYFICKMRIYYLFGEISIAKEFLEKANPFMEALLGLPWMIDYTLFSFLIEVEQYSLVSHLEKEKLDEFLEKNLNQMNLWSEHCPDNFQAPFLIMKATFSKVKGNVSEAILLYDKAIESAQKNGYLQYEALSNELAGKLYLSKKEIKAGKAYLKDAYFCYELWGAKAKANNLGQKYSVSSISLQQKYDLKNKDNLSTLENIQINSTILDTETILKAYQSISNEISFDNLLKKLMYFLIENAGAKTGILILIDKNDLNPYVHAEAQIEKQPKIISKIPLEKYKNLPQSVTLYSIRTKYPVVLENAIEKGNYTDDFYIQKNEVKSLLCVPIVKQSHLIGLIYLENNISTNAFTQNHINMIQTLATQIASFIEVVTLNKDLEYLNQNLEKEIEKKRQELEKTQDYLIQTEKITALGRATARVAHELNTPISNTRYSIQNIENITNQFLNDLTQDNGNRGDDFFQKVSNYKNDITKLKKIMLSSVNKTAEIVTSFKQISIDQEKGEKREFNLLSYIEESIFSMQSFLKSKNITVNIKGDNPNIYLDPSIFHQITQNLITNAVKYAYSEEGGIIDITIKEKNESIELNYIDYGKGIPKENCLKIFDPFFTTGGGKGGTGLGLNIVYKNVTTHLNGTIHCKSKLGKGSNFMIEFPKVKEKKNDA